MNLPDGEPISAATTGQLELPSTPANSLFVANLPLRLNNHELAWSLFQSFRQFGQLRLIRASRDIRGRPFGFVDFLKESDGEAALNQAFNPGIIVAGRQARVERARFQARLIVTPPILDMLDHEEVVVRHQSDRSILQFDDRETAVVVYEQIRKMCTEQSSLMWLLPGHHVGGQRAIVRSSGLVQLAPDGSDLLKMARPSFLKPSNNNGNASNHNHLYTFEEEEFCGNDDDDDDDGAEREQHHSDVYVGRLCSWRVTRDLLRERFSQYGRITYIRLFNRGVIRPDNPVDAFSHIGFKDKIDQNRAIENEDGECWLGQVITVQPLILSKAFKIKTAAKALCNDCEQHDAEISV